MRIALDATYSVDPNPSGIAIYSRELMNGLAQGHPEDQFLHCYRPKQLLRAASVKYSNVRRVLLAPPLKTFRCHVFHALNQRVDARPAPKVVSTFHDLFVIAGDYSSAEFRRRFADQATSAARHSDLIITVSEFTATQVAELLNFPRVHIRVIPHGVHLPHEPLSSGRENLVLFIGALQKRKNLVRLVRAFAAMPENWKLVLAGSPRGYEANKVLEAVAASPARQRIEVTGYISDSQRDNLLRRARIFAFPSLDEGFGMPVLEAMAYQVPVITADRSGTAELAREAALLVNPLSEDELAEALRQLADDASLGTSLIQAGLSRARQFTWDLAAERTYNVYCELVC